MWSGYPPSFLRVQYLACYFYANSALCVLYNIPPKPGHVSLHGLDILSAVWLFSVERWSNISTRHMLSAGSTLPVYNLSVEYYRNV